MTGEEHSERKAQKAHHGFVAGGLSSLTARFVTFPADTLKARLQVVGALVRGAGGKPTTWGAARAMMAREGVGGFYRGFGAVCLGAVPAQTVYFSAYEFWKGVVPKQAGVLGDMAVGGLTQLVAGVAFTPVDVIKERLQVHSLLRSSQPTAHAAETHAHSIALARNIVQQHDVLGLFRGYWLTNCVWIPWNIAFIACYEQSKRMSGLHGTSTTDGMQAVLAHLACASGSAAAAAVITHPVDVLKTRLQVLPSELTRQYSVQGILEQLLRHEGAQAFWSGLSARVLTIAPGAAISWVCYEQIKALLIAWDA